MSLELLQATDSVSPYAVIAFEGDGGVEPYVYSVVSGGGSINASTGIYTAPGSTAVVVVKVTDDDDVEATATLNVRSPLELFCEVIKEEMELEDDQVFLWDQKFNVPNDSRLYIAVGVLTCKPFSNINYLNSAGQSVQEVNMQATLSVDIMSRNTSALTRKEEVILALQSNYAQSQQEINSFYIGKISSSFVNLSQEEGAAIPYRFNISVNIQYFSTKIKTVPYYDTFEGPEVTTEP